MRRLSIILAICMPVLVLCPAGNAYARESVGLPDPGITPDSPFYFFDELAKQIALRFTFSEEARVQKLLQYAEERLAEMNYMMASNNVRAAMRAMNGYNDYIDAVMEMVESEGAQVNGVRAMVVMAMEKHNAVFDEVEGEVPEEAGATMTQTRERACICQQLVLNLIDQEGPETATQVKLMLRERQRNNVRVTAGNEEAADGDIELADVTGDAEQDTGESAAAEPELDEEEDMVDRQKKAWHGESSECKGPDLHSHWGQKN